MKGVAIYFSGTGNTEYVIKQFKEEFEKQNIICELIDTVDKESIENDYDFYIFAGPVHAELFPITYINWVKANINKVQSKKCIIISTQAAKSGSAIVQLSEILERKGMDIIIRDCIPMPNNYYVVAFKQTTEEENNKIRVIARKHVESLVKKFLNEEKYIKKISSIRVGFSKIEYKFFYKYSKVWAKKKISVDEQKCIRCKKCIHECPTKNISIENNILIFSNKCISCQRCLHRCPTNAFLYKNKHFEQYKSY